MNKTVLGLGVVILLFVGGSFLVKSDGIYCSPLGTLTDEQSIQSHRSYCLKSNGDIKNYSFSIIDDQGGVVKDFAITHTKLMHVIVVRKDLANFQHLHPEYDETTGVFTLSNLAFPTEGNYRIFADFATTGMHLPVTVFEDIKVGSSSISAPLGTLERSKTFNGVQVALSTAPADLVSGSEAMLTFDLKVTDLEEYLGAMGHAVVLKEGTLDFIHAHPMEKVTQDGRVEFMLTFPTAGRYKVFTQFQREGNVFTTDFVVSVAQGTPGLDGGVDHSIH